MQIFSFTMCTRVSNASYLQSKIFVLQIVFHYKFYENYDHLEEKNHQYANFLHRNCEQWNDSVTIAQIMVASLYVDTHNHNLKP